MDQLLKDEKGFTIGKIVTTSDGMQSLKDAGGFLKGSYDPNTNKTKNAEGIPVGVGNLLATLLD